MGRHLIVLGVTCAHALRTQAVSSGLLLLSMVTHYMQCLANLQTVATHVAQKLPALLKLFHTKAYQQARLATDAATRL